MSAALSWIAGSDTGTSSKAIWSHMMSGSINADDRVFGVYPHDPADFGRCYRLLSLVPEWRPRIIEMAKYDSVWATLAVHWDELTALYEQHVRDNGGERGLFKALYDRMKELEANATRCSTCGQPTNGSYSKDLKTGRRACHSCQHAPKAVAV